MKHQPQLRRVAKRRGHRRVLTHTKNNRLEPEPSTVGRLVWGATGLVIGSIQFSES